jgi:hypothetical protein
LILKRLQKNRQNIRSAGLSSRSRVFARLRGYQGLKFGGEEHELGVQDGLHAVAQLNAIGLFLEERSKAYSA